MPLSSPCTKGYSASSSASIQSFPVDDETTLNSKTVVRIFNAPVCVTNTKIVEGFERLLINSDIFWLPWSLPEFDVEQCFSRIVVQRLNCFQILIESWCCFSKSWKLV